MMSIIVVLVLWILSVKTMRKYVITIDQCPWPETSDVLFFFRRMPSKRCVTAHIYTVDVLFSSGRTKKMKQSKVYDEKQPLNSVSDRETIDVQQITMIFSLDLSSTGKRLKRSDLLSDLRKHGGKDETSEKKTNDDNDDDEAEERD